MVYRRYNQGDIMTKEDMCEALAEDYADRVARVGSDYDDAYEHYLARCRTREASELKSQLISAGLDKSGFLYGDR